MKRAIILLSLALGAGCAADQGSRVRDDSLLKPYAVVFNQSANNLAEQAELARAEQKWGQARRLFLRAAETKAKSARVLAQAKAWEEQARRQTEQVENMIKRAECMRPDNNPEGSWEEAS